LSSQPGVILNGSEGSGRGQTSLLVVNLILHSVQDDKVVLNRSAPEAVLTRDAKVV
jgi:hypothetical protein